jgi:hypothetical protein
LHEQLIPLGEELATEVTKSPGTSNLRMLRTFLHKLEANAEIEQLERLWRSLLVELRAHGLRTKGSRPRSKSGKTNTSADVAREFLVAFELEHGNYSDKSHGAVAAFAKRRKKKESTMFRILQRAHEQRERNGESAAESRESPRER